jgi:hypothetical protein
MTLPVALNTSPRRYHGNSREIAAAVGFYANKGHLYAVTAKREVGLVWWLVLIFLPLYCGGLGFAAERYGEWSLDELVESGSKFLRYREWVPFGDTGEIAEVSFVCDRRRKPSRISAMLIPVKSEFNNQEKLVTVLVRPDRHDGPRLIQRWHGGYGYIWLNDPPEVDRLVNHIEQNQTNGVERLVFVFSGNFYGKIDKSEYFTQVSVELAGFSDGLRALRKICA